MALQNILKKSKGSGIISRFKTNDLKRISCRTTSYPTKMTVYILQLHVPTIIPDEEPQFDYKESNRAFFVLSFDSSTAIRKSTQPDLAFQA